MLLKMLNDIVRRRDTEKNAIVRVAPTSLAGVSLEEDVVHSEGEPLQDLVAE